ncbi:MAG TPA: hypothetical protein VHE55_10120 [Fimbriimonadaceae bacterium]|nr:hypothetical protein [Fimbriimonadaceae bacterium]
MIYRDVPSYFAPAGLWLFGNVRLLGADLALVPRARGRPDHLPIELDAIEREAEEIALGSQILVCGIHNAAHQRSAVVPLRWGAPRILVLSGGFYYHFGKELRDEPFRAARLWRYQFDSTTDLAISRRAPEKLPTFGLYNPTVDRLITMLVLGTCPGLRSAEDRARVLDPCH